MTIFNQVQRDDAWVLRMADVEEGVSIEVGGLHGRLDAMNEEAAPRTRATAADDADAVKSKATIGSQSG